MQTIESHPLLCSRKNAANRAGKVGTIALVIISGVAGAFVMHRFDCRQPDPVAELVGASTTPNTPASSDSNDVTPPVTDILELPQDRWEASGIQLQPAVRGPFAKSVHLTGKISLNHDRVAHIYPLVEGTVEQVSVGLGETVKAGQLLATIHSREIGEAKLRVFQSRLQLEMSRSKHELQTEVARNVTDLIEALRNRIPIEEIESQFRSRPMGEFRERLLAAYSSYTNSEADVTRLQGITTSGAVSGKTLLQAKANRNADLASYQSRLEEVEYGMRMASMLSSHSLKESETMTAVSETSLRILGVSDDELKTINPATQGEGISHYSIRAPFDGTVLTKDVVLSEQVRPDVMVLSIADLSTVWVLVDLYEEHVPLLESLGNQTIHLHSESWPGQTFDAKVFFAGETMDESTRTISLRAIAENAQHLLKPGMFVTADLSGTGQEDVLQVPLSAIQEHQGQKFVFVHRGEDQFERRSITLGPANETTVTIKEGLEPNEAVVVQGGFMLKSQMLADLMGEE